MLFPFAILLALLLLLNAVAAQDCDQCGSCEVIEEACVEKLTVDELFVDCHQVPPFDGDPCTNEDIVDGETVKVHIPGCCTDDESCDQFKPDSCYLSTCVIAEGDTHGTCEHTRIENCCNDNSECPKQKCYDYVCDETCPESTELLFTSSSGGIGHRRAWSKRAISLDTQCKRCVGTKRPGCCLTSGDCDFGGALGNCTQHEIGICDGNHECVCVPNKGEECTHQTEEEDCAYLTPKLEKCPNECAAIHCVKGHCVIEIDEDVDFDHDNVTCADDCDDRNATISSFVWCGAVAGQNDDEDAFLKCGTEVNRRCGECLAGEMEVPEDSFDCAPENLPDGPCMLTRECDCCDHSPSQERPDEVACCKIDCNPNDNGVLECNGEPRQVCVTKSADPDPDADTEMENQCQKYGMETENKPCDCDPSIIGLDCTNCWHASTDAPCPVCLADPVEECNTQGGGERKRACAAKKKKRQVVECDECPNSDATSADLTCFLDCDGDDEPVCDPETGSALECCQALHDRHPEYEHVQQQVRDCCDAIIRESNADTATDENNLFPADGNAATFPATASACNYTSTPYIPNQCNCTDGYIDSASFNDTTHTDYCDCTSDLIGQDYIAECAPDADSDCVPSCETERVCVPLDPASNSIVAVCASVGMLAPSPSQCDCDDSDPTASTYHGCFADVDGDTFVNCTSCVSTCGECPEGTHPLTPVLLGQRAPPKVRAPLGGSRHVNAAGHRHAKRQEPECPEFPVYIPCPCSAPIEPGDQCTDEEPPKPIGQRCDCCDIDPYAFPGSRWCSTRPRVCPDEETGDPSFDYNCDDDDDHLVVCEDHGDEEDGNDDIVHDTDDGRDRYMRGCQPENDDDANSPEVFTETEQSGECKFNETIQNCTTVHGFCLERKRNIGDIMHLGYAANRKRAMGDGHIQVHAPIECDNSSIVDPEDVTPPLFGSCFEYIEECHARTHHNVTMCHCDCDICVMVGQ